jgi:hypothetical protein
MKEKKRKKDNFGGGGDLEREGNGVWGPFFCAFLILYGV